ncbi:MAG: hypothetical protein KJN97_06185 [Deltaproteobacteria bacterium]|nr:hypothetical protein [Deltaproteobacteria bacterium]
MTTYYEKLKDPRWQRRRLEIMERDGFACFECDDDKSTLHVHHGYYQRGLDPWDYDPDTLWTLCEGCHELVQDYLADFHRLIGGATLSEMQEMFAAAERCLAEIRE